MIGVIEGKTIGGRSRARWLDAIKEVTQMGLSELRGSA